MGNSRLTQRTCKSDRGLQKVAQIVESLFWRYSRQVWMSTNVTCCRETALAGGWTQWSSEVPSNPYNSVIPGEKPCCTPYPPFVGTGICAAPMKHCMGCPAVAWADHTEQGSRCWLQETDLGEGGCVEESQKQNLSFFFFPSCHAIKSTIFCLCKQFSFWAEPQECGPVMKIYNSIWSWMFGDKSIPRNNI